MFIRIVLYFGAAAIFVTSGIVFGFREIIPAGIAFVGLVIFGETLSYITTRIRVKKDKEIQEEALKKYNEKREGK